VGRYLMATYKVDERARALSFEAARVARVNPAANSGWPTVAALAKEAGVEVTGYAQNSAGATVALRVKVSGTWLIGPALAIVARQPWVTPFPLDAQATSQG
jgi:hypothetical protein